MSWSLTVELKHEAHMAESIHRHNVPSHSSSLVVFACSLPSSTGTTILSASLLSLLWLPSTVAFAAEISTLLSSTAVVLPHATRDSKTMLLDKLPVNGTVGSVTNLVVAALLVLSACAVVCGLEVASPTTELVSSAAASMVVKRALRVLTAITMVAVCALFFLNWRLCVQLLIVGCMTPWQWDTKMRDSSFVILDPCVTRQSECLA
jgi:hypothetical protein